jgi:hypothetical protein
MRPPVGFAFRSPKHPAHRGHCRPRAKRKIVSDQSVIEMAGPGGRQIHSCETIHPANLSGLAGRWQQSVNHSEPNVTTKGNEAPRGAVFSAA